MFHFRMSGALYWPISIWNLTYQFYNKNSSFAPFTYQKSINTSATKLTLLTKCVPWKGDIWIEIGLLKLQHTCLEYHSSKCQNQTLSWKRIYISVKNTIQSAIINLWLCAIKRAHFEIERLLCDTGNKSLKGKSYGELVKYLACSALVSSNMVDATKDNNIRNIWMESLTKHLHNK